jgi:hypothetical protein
MARIPALLAALWVVTALSGCAAGPRLPPPRVTDGSAVPLGFPADVRLESSDWPRMQREAPELLARLRQASAGGAIHILALSGGGAGAAFGAGALVGWSHTGTRPQFEVVTGVSAGALVAPLAFLGAGWDGELTAAFSVKASQQLLQRQWGGMILGTSLYRGEPLRDLVERFATPRLLAAVAAESAKGRLLLVATTNLDRESTVIWNLGAIAQQGGSAARELFCDVLVASASVPGVFPPVLIRVQQGTHVFEELHVDGGTTDSVFIAPEIVSIAPGLFGSMSGADAYILVNGQFGTALPPTRPQTVAIVKRSILATMRGSSRADAETALLTARQMGMRIQVSSIPDDYPFPGALDFEADSMQRLFNYGVRCGSAGRVWSTPLEALRRNSTLHVSSTGQEAVACPATGGLMAGPSP